MNLYYSNVANRREREIVVSNHKATVSFSSLFSFVGVGVSPLVGDPPESADRAPSGLEPLTLLAFLPPYLGSAVELGFFTALLLLPHS